MKILKIYTLFYFLILASFANAQGIVQIDNTIKTINDVKVGADRTTEYLPLLKGKSVAVVANQSSVIRKTHLVDSLITLGIKVKKVFCPEHGFRGTVDAGEKVETEKDPKTGLNIISLYGKNNKKPKPEDLKDVDIVIFDIHSWAPCAACCTLRAISLVAAPCSSTAAAIERGRD